MAAAERARVGLELAERTRKKDDYLFVEQSLTILGRLVAHPQISHDGLYRPSVQVLATLLGTSREAVKAKELEQARQILEGVSSGWVMHPVVVEVMRARYAGATGDLPTARNLLTKARQRLIGLPPNDRDFIQKEIDEIEASLPK